MSNETIIIVVGNLTDDPELRFTPSGAALARFSIASTPRRFDKASGEYVDADTLFLRATASLTFATAKVTKTTRANKSSGNPDDPWTSANRQPVTAGAPAGGGGSADGRWANSDREAPPF
jgi:single-strand DNA-binding protein